MRTLYISLIMSNHTALDEKEVLEKFGSIVAKSDFSKMNIECRHLCEKYSNVLPFIFQIIMDPSFPVGAAMVCYDKLVEFASNFIILNIAPSTVDHCFAAYCIMRDRFAKRQFSEVIGLFHWIEDFVCLLPHGFRQQCYCMTIEAFFAQSKFSDCRGVLLQMQDNLDEMMPIIEEREIAEAQIQHNKYSVRLKLVDPEAAPLLSDQEIETASSCVDSLRESIELVNNKAIREIHKGRPGKALEMLESLKDPPLFVSHNIAVARLLNGKHSGHELVQYLEEKICKAHGSRDYDCDIEMGDVRRTLGLFHLFSGRYDAALPLLFRTLRSNNPVDLLRVSEALSNANNATSWNLHHHLGQGHIESLSLSIRNKTVVKYSLIDGIKHWDETKRLEKAFELLLRAKTLVEFAINHSWDVTIDKHSVHDTLSDLKMWREKFPELNMAITLQLACVSLSLGHYVICRKMCSTILANSVDPHQKFLAHVYMAEVHLYFEKNPDLSFKSLEKAEKIIDHINEVTGDPMRSLIWNQIPFFADPYKLMIVLLHNQAFILAADEKYKEASSLLSALREKDRFAPKEPYLDTLTNAGFVFTLDFFMDYLYSNKSQEWRQYIKSEANLRSAKK